MKTRQKETFDKVSLLEQSVSEDTILWHKKGVADNISILFQDFSIVESLIIVAFSRPGYSTHDHAKSIHNIHNTGTEW